MAKIYANLIKNNLKKIEEVPDGIREDVRLLSEDYEA